MTAYQHKIRAALGLSIYAVVAVSRAVAKNCIDDSIREVSESGEIVTMLSGSVYEVLAGDEIDSMLWLPAEDVLICETTTSYQGRTYIFY